MPYVRGMKKKESIENAICINMFMKHEFDVKHENELKYEYEHEREMAICHKNIMWLRRPLL